MPLADKEEKGRAVEAQDLAKEGIGTTLVTEEGPNVRFLPGGRDVRLLGPMTFIDAAGVKWLVPAGAVVNGGSIPRFFWRAIGTPFVGLYRNATILHDYYCDVRSRPSPQVHQMFWEKMRKDGVNPVQAWLMWAAVRVFGPRF
jgi:hypothetical protein